MALLGALSGSNTFIRVKTETDWLTIGGQISHTQTSSNTAIDITCKQNGGNRDILDGAGLQIMDVTSELIFSTDAAFDFMRAASVSRSIETYQIVKQVDNQSLVLDEFNAILSSWGENAADNDKVMASVTFTTNSDWSVAVQYEQLLVTADSGELGSEDKVFTSNGAPIFVRK